MKRRGRKGASPAHSEADAQQEFRWLQDFRIWQICGSAWEGLEVTERSLGEEVWDRKHKGPDH